MDIFNYDQLRRVLAATGKNWLEFMRSSSLSVGLYELPAGGTDLQEPHTEDEVYIVMQGKATINVNGEDQPVQAGSVVYVAKQVPHKFHTIEEDLSVLVLFAPPESSGLVS